MKIKTRLFAIALSTVTLVSLTTGCASGTRQSYSNNSMASPLFGYHSTDQKYVTDYMRMQSQLNALHRQSASNPYWNKQTFMQMQPMMRMHR